MRRPERPALAALAVVPLFLSLNMGIVPIPPKPPLVGGTNVFTLTVPPAYCVNEKPNGCFQGPGMAYVSYKNNYNQTVLGVVLWVVHNGLGQTVAYGAASIQVQSGGNLTAYPKVSGLPPGLYNSSVFVISTAGIAISNSSSLQFALTE